jgi:hypothetical protein
MSYLFTVIQYIRSETASIPESSTHRYAGGTAQIRSKNRMTRHESRRPSPKVTGPSVPDANLRKRAKSRAGLRTQLRERNTHDKMFIFADIHMKNILMKCVSVLSSTATGWIPIKWQARECGSQNSAQRSLIRSIRLRIRDMIRTPRLHSPCQELLRKKTNKVGGRGCPGGSNNLLKRVFFTKAPSLH